ncbi:MAG: hypothetical protein ABMA64_31120 [Myxococcota bacterium]
MSRRALAAIALALVPSPALAFCNEWTLSIFYSHCEDAGHDAATENLSFLRSLVFSVMNEAVGDQDGGAEEDMDDHHFDSCRFEESAAFIRRQHDLVLDRLDPADPDVFGAAYAFGALLHPVQDFYAHANWSELLEQTEGPWAYVDPEFLIDRGTGPFRGLEPLSVVRDDIIVGSVPPGGLPAGWVARADPYSAIPVIDIPGIGTLRALVTGWNADGACVDVRPGEIVDEFSHDGEPRTRRLVHGAEPDSGNTDRPCEYDSPTGVCLNKDEPGRPYYGEANTLAGWQSQAEWCRLLHRARDTRGLETASELMTLWASPSLPPHPQATECAPAAPGPVEVRVSVDSTSGTSGVRAAFALYTDDFRQSVASESVGRPTNTLSLCVDPDDTPVATLWGWREDSDGISGLDQFDQVKRGVTLAIDPTTPSQVRFVDGLDLDATFRVEIDVTDVDGDNLSSCAEAFHGTSDTSTDTDDDLLWDDTEVILGTDPTNYDTDGDFASDFFELFVGSSDPLDPDTDDDGLEDGSEWWEGTDPHDPDTDDDGLTDGFEVKWGSDPLLPDTDADRVLDWLELEGWTDVRTADTDLDGIEDGLDIDWVIVAVGELDPGSFSDKDGDGQKKAALEALYGGQDALRLGDPSPLVKAREQIAACWPGKGEIAPPACVALDGMIERVVGK